MLYFCSQSFPDIRDKLKCLQKVSLTLWAEVLIVTFKVHHGKDEKIPQTKKHLMVAKAFYWPYQLPRLSGLPKSKNLQVSVSNAIRRVIGPGNL